jgi:urate oxidase
MASNTDFFDYDTDFFDYERIEDLPNKDSQNFYTETKTVLIKFIFEGYFDEADNGLAFLVKADAVKKMYCGLKNEGKDTDFHDFLMWVSIGHLSKYEGRASQIIRGSPEWNKFADVYITIRLLRMIVRNDPIPFFLK